ncbi:cytochrome P450 [Coniophora puteana RWD-64-598 SS2]|uniref:Cytochrome P450 n=1 Tax=Coniophora puteana (strain RWD-64-598) TaxID=741705 RepID=A0A5M3MXE5_CONPW|nr:cytochrome P450 [Coniophora puteana RWD-64-598 SS2]EIW83762.1 cytochrome P450 [Coniophora puteana RWD-64-598 SS2]
MFGQHFIIINSLPVARALMEKRSSIYSDRPVIPTAELMGIGFSTVHRQYGDEWRLHRKLFHQALRAESASTYRSTYARKTHGLLSNLLESPATFTQHLKSHVASTVMAMTYGYETKPNQDPIVDNVEELIRLLEKELAPERAVALTMFPFLARVPSWFPGGGFKESIARGQSFSERVMNEPFDFVLRTVANGTAPPSMVSDLLGTLDEKEDYQTQEQAIREAAATVFIDQGLLQSASVLQSFVLAMLLHPHIQARAHAEIDAIVGNDRLPSFEDRPSMPYIEAIIREVLRWRPVVPLGIPHATAIDDYYEGYFIPKGAIVIMNAWAMSRDPSRFDDPESFRPERHFTFNGKLIDSPLTTDPVFGLGRRNCPGKFASDELLWITIVSVLAVFKVEHALDANGRPVEVGDAFEGGIAIHPRPFACNFTPRYPSVPALVRSTCTKK